MSKLECEFAFDIGQMVYIRSALHDFDHTPNRFVITERWSQQCETGVQRLYRLYGNIELVPEVVLSYERPPYQEFPDEKMSKILSTLGIAKKKE